MTAFARRRFLAGTSALLTAPFWPSLGLASEPDVVVIGAGAAGIAAAKKLLAAGRSVTIVEAADRIGGRVVTDSAIFGAPFDLGAHWLHYGEDNPFVDYGQEQGFTLYEAPEDEILYVGDREATAAEYKAFEVARKAAATAIDQAGKAGRDVSPASVVPDLGPWHDTVHLMLGPYAMAKDFDRFSCLDWYSAEEGTNWYCKEGFGALWAHSARGVPVQLGTRAEVVRWGGPGVAVETSRGTIRARACIVTVSTGVLAQEGLRFDPPLSAAKRDVFHGISMGLYNHIALRFRENIFGIGDDGYVTYKLDADGARSPTGIGLLTNVSGSGLTYADVGGALAGALEAEGEAAALDFALGELRGLFGSSVERAFVKGSVTAWGRNPLTRGAYASAEPGATPQRAMLRAPVGERIWFAGEACHDTEWATVGGAHKSGRAVAEAVMKAL